jgi:hypothetical protein
MPDLTPPNVYRDQLSSLALGIALWDPAPQKKSYEKVSIGDVGYLHPSYGTFIRLFNVILPWNDPSNEKFGKLEHYDSLDLGQFDNTLEHQLQKVVHCSRSVTVDTSSNILQAMGPDE